MINQKYSEIEKIPFLPSLTGVIEKADVVTEIVETGYREVPNDYGIGVYVDVLTNEGDQNGD